jgi:hypothetical protein
VLVLSVWRVEEECFDCLAEMAVRLPGLSAWMSDTASAPAAGRRDLENR